MPRRVVIPHELDTVLGGGNFGGGHSPHRSIFGLIRNARRSGAQAASAMIRASRPRSGPQRSDRQPNARSRRSGPGSATLWACLFCTAARSTSATRIVCRGDRDQPAVGEPSLRWRERRRSTTPDERTRPFVVGGRVVNDATQTSPRDHALAWSTPRLRDSRRAILAVRTAGPPRMPWQQSRINSRPSPAAFRSRRLARSPKSSMMRSRRGA